MKAIRSEKEVRAIREACQVAATVLRDLVDAVEEGVSTYDLDQLGREKMQALGAESACLNYRVGDKVFPAHTCISINEEIVHGIGDLRRVVGAGDAVSIDVVVCYGGYIGDNARTVVVPPASDALRQLVEAGEGALHHALDFARAGNRVGDVSSAVERYVERRGFGIVREFVGHGIGKTMHEPPQIPNFGKAGTGPRLKPGMVLAIEPMINLGSPGIEILADGWTAVTADRKPSAHFEHSVLVKEGAPEILTIPKN